MWSRRTGRWGGTAGVGRGRRATLIVVAFCFTICARSATAQWRVVPELRVGGGDESDLLIDPQIAGAIVPGGPFAELAPAIAARHWLGNRGLVRVAASATFQQFLNEQSRLLFGQTVSGDALWNLGHSLRGRLSLSIDFFDDSERESVRRFGLGGEAGLAVVRKSWSAELWAGGRGRRYPNVDVLGSIQQVSTYAEATVSGGTRLRVVPHARVDLGLEGLLQETDSRDSYFDSESWTVSANADLAMISTLFGSAYGAYQDRHFTARAADEDQDRYRQLGAGLRYAFAAGWEASLKWGYAVYTWPDGTEEDTHRLAIGIRYAWGRQAPPVPRVDLEALVRDSGGSFQQRDSLGNVSFRVRAPGAQAVSVMGTFNEWSPEALRDAGDGWWEVRVDLKPGTYEYIYIIDGKWTTPPEARLTVEDGFGGTNGILEVLPSDV